jgi:hypothetical protein
VGRSVRVLGVGDEPGPHPHEAAVVTHDALGGLAGRVAGLLAALPLDDRTWRTSRSVC